MVSIERARSLRKRMPPAEARMWTLLRQEPFAEFHFRRQVPIGPYYADFASHAAKLVIEIDGDTHGMQEAKRYDAERDLFLNSAGYAVLRFSNSDVVRNLTGVAEALSQCLTPTPALTRRPSPQGGGRRQPHERQQVAAQEKSS